MSTQTLNRWGATTTIVTAHLFVAGAIALIVVPDGGLANPVAPTLYYLLDPGCANISHNLCGAGEISRQTRLRRLCDVHPWQHHVQRTHLHADGRHIRCGNLA